MKKFTELLYDMSTTKGILASPAYLVSEFFITYISDLDFIKEIYEYLKDLQNDEQQLLKDYSPMDMGFKSKIARARYKIACIEAYLADIQVINYFNLRTNKLHLMDKNIFKIFYDRYIYDNKDIYGIDAKKPTKKQKAEFDCWFKYFTSDQILPDLS